MILVGVLAFSSLGYAGQRGTEGMQPTPVVPVTPETDSAPDAGSVTLKSLIDEALRQNPRIRTFEQRWESTKLRVPQAGAWMDPRLSVNIINFPVSEASFRIEPMTQKQISLMQTIPFPGITSLKEEIASRESDIAENTYTDVRNAIVRDVSLAFYDIYLFDKSVEITLKNKKLLEDFITIASKKYEVGGGLQQDVLKAQVEFSKLLDKLIMYRKRREGVTARLNALLDRPPGSVIGTVEELRHTPLELDEQSLQTSAREGRPVLQALQSKIQRSKSAFQLANKQYWPNFSVGVAYGQRNDRRDFITALFSLNLPLWKNRKQDKKVEEAAVNIRAAEEMLEDRENDIEGKIVSLVASLEENDERIRLLRNVIIPQAAQSLNSATAGYQVNKVDFLTLLNNQITLFNFELDYYRLLTAYKKDMTNLEFVVGQPVN